MNKVRVAVVAAVMTLSGTVVAQQPPAASPPPPDFSKVEIKTTDLGDNVYMLEGQGGNITVAVAKDGIIMVDGEFAPLHDKIKAAVAAISNQPIKYLDQHAFSRRPHRRKRTLRQGRRHRRRPRSTSRTGSRRERPTD